jgi:hypothetical protein
VPVSHLVDDKLPAVSGSSGHLVVERLKEPGQEPDYPGKVFADPELDYAEAVQAFVQASQPLFGSRIESVAVEKPSEQAEIQQLRQEEAQLCSERRNTRQHRKLEDAAWQVTWQQHRRETPSATQNAKPKLRALGFSQSPRRTAPKLAPTTSSTISATPTGRRTGVLAQKKFTRTNDLVAHGRSLDCHFGDHR